VPQVSGSYTFWIAGDDNCVLALSTDSNPANAVDIATVTGWTAPLEWNKYSTQQSVAIELVAGQYYYIRALQKENWGGDHIAVAWQGPGFDRQVIASYYLAPSTYIDIVPPTPNPMSFATAPYATGTTTIAMTATTASDASGVEYYFTCITDASKNSGWQDSPSYTATGLTPATQYSFTVMARDKSANQNATTASAVASATTESIQLVYPTSYGQSQYYEWIGRVMVGSIDNNSGNSVGYGDFTSLSTSHNKGASVSFTLTPGFSGSSYTENWRIWIDYNQDGDFDDTGELVYSGNSASAISSSFTIPTSALSGPTRMRISMKYGSYPGPAEIFADGEVEDYTITLN
jgi:hypothetical protein